MTVLQVLIAAAALQITSAPPALDLSAQARAALLADAARPPATDLPSRRARAEAIQQEIGQRQLARYHVTMRETFVAGIPVRVFEPSAGARTGAILLNLHGGGFVVDSGSITENVPIAALTGYRVIAVRYRLAPEAPFPSALDDATAVYRALQAKMPRNRIAVYGTSAGAILAGELIARLQAEHAALPMALGFFSGSGDLSVAGDSAEMFLPKGAAAGTLRPYLGSRQSADPDVSPARGSLEGWPATLCLSSTRDILLSATASMCRALDDAGTPAKLIVHDGLPHAFWSYVEAPESDAAFQEMARFFRQHLDRKP